VRSADRDARRRVDPRRVLWHVVLVVAVVLGAFPVAWAVLASIKPDGELFEPSPVSLHPTLAHYADVLAHWPIGALLLNTLEMAVGVALGQTVIAILGAFALARVRRGRRIVVALLAISLAIPPQAIVVPQFLLTAKLGWIGTEVGLIVPQLGGSALAVLILLQHVDAIAPSLHQAARVEGARILDELWHIVLPALRPGIIAVAILVFITTWNEYLWPLIVAPADTGGTMQMGLARFQASESTDFGSLLAASTLSALPILLVYLIASRRITDAFTASGVR
jgi:ABC-type glycerol-3-phosphate transport system permease component